MDKITKEQRSRNMAAIRSIGSKTTEAEFAKLLKKSGITGWRRPKKGAFGSPDFLFSKSRTAVFTDGCFWHGCKKHCIMPKSNTKYWKPKIARNMARDKEVTGHYRSKGWHVLRVWEHEIKSAPEKAVARLKTFL